MASRLKSGRFIGAATSESARRQLMQPVPCWEKIWVVPESAAPGSALKVLKWVKTEKKQQFSDDEDAMDEPLMPLPDEPIQDDEDEEEKEQEGTAPPISRDVSEPATARPSVPPDDVEVESKPHPLSVSFIPTSQVQPMDDSVDDGTLDSSLNPSLGVGVPTSLNGVAVNVSDHLNVAIDAIDTRQFAPGIEAFDPSAVADDVMQDALQNGMPEMLRK